MEASLLGILLAVLLPFASLQGLTAETADCSDSDYALMHPDECGQPVSCDNADYALNHPEECGQLVDCGNPDYALTHPDECGVPVVGCDDPDYALNHPEECGTPISPELPDLVAGQVKVFVGGAEVSSVTEGEAVVFKSVVSNTKPFNAGSFVIKWFIDGSVAGSETFSAGLAANSVKESSVTWTAVSGRHVVDVIADQKNDVEEENELNNHASSGVDVSCKEKLVDNYRCSGNDRQKEKITATCATQWVTVETCAYGCDITLTATCNPKPTCKEKLVDNYRCLGNKRQRERLNYDCTTDWVTLQTCTYGCQRIWADSSLPVSCISLYVAPTPTPPACMPSVLCSTLGCGTTDSCGNYCGDCPVIPGDNPPSATINVPDSAAPGSQMSIAVTGADDKDVAQLLLYDSSSNLLETFNCDGVQTSCSNTFARTAPSAYSTSYTFSARSRDSANQFSGFVSGTGTTTAAPVVPPVVPPPAPVTPPVPVTPPPAVAPTPEPKPLQAITIKFPLQPLFLRALNFPDSDCVRPGESALLAVKVQNTGRATLKDVKFTAAVPELGIRVSNGPVKLTTKDKSTRFLRLEVPEDADEGAYHLRFTVSNNKFKRTVYRTFVVGSRC